MLLIMFMGLVAKLALVFGDCNVGDHGVEDFNFDRSTGTWFVLYHLPNDVEDNVTCVSATYKPLEGNNGSVTLQAFVFSAKAFTTLQGNTTNQVGYAFDEFFDEPTIWSGRYYVIATDYNGYIILKMCSFKTNNRIKSNMLLIMFMGLVANLALVCGDCDPETQGVKNFDYSKAIGDWFVLYHISNDVENSITCVSATYTPLVDNVGTVNLKSYVPSEKSFSTLQGNVTNQNGNAFDEIFVQQVIWSGRYYVVATDYTGYIILKLCSFETNELYIYVAFRNKQPDPKTEKRAKKELAKNNIDFNTLVPWEVNNCS